MPSHPTGADGTASTTSPADAPGPTGPTGQHDHLELTVDGQEVTLTGTARGDQAHRRLVPPPWRWSRTAAGWVLPRSLLPMTRGRHIEHLLRSAAAAGIVVDVEDTGQQVTEQDRRQARTERLEIRADRHQGAADRAAAESGAAEAASRRISDGIPPGQPILVGHHSEGRHRRALERMHTLDRRSWEADREARLRAERAENLRRALDRGDSPVTIRLRIERHQAEIRSLQRTLDRVPDRPTDNPTDNPTGGSPRGGAVDRWRAEVQRLQAAVELDQALIAHLEAAGKTVTYSRENVSVGDWVEHSGMWLPVQRVNPKSVTVPSLMGSWTNTLPYLKITGLRPGGTKAADAPATELGPADSPGGSPGGSPAAGH